MCVKGRVLKYSFRIFMVTKTTSLVGAFVIVFEFYFSRFILELKRKSRLREFEKLVSIKRT